MTGLSVKREKFLADAIERILMQSFDACEFIIVNDCSTDGAVGSGDVRDGRHGYYHSIELRERFKYSSTEGSINPPPADQKSFYQPIARAWAYRLPR